MSEKKVSPVFKALKAVVKAFYPRYTFEGLEQLPDEPCLIIANHVQAHGPLACELWFPIPRYTWCIGQMLHAKEVAEYAYTDFWSHKPRSVRWFYKLCAHVLAYPAAFIMQNANTIGVYKDHRLVSTFRQTANTLLGGHSVVIFPECYDEYNNIVNRFQEGFVDAARLYHRKTGKEIAFVPLYLAPRLRKGVFGVPVRFDASAKMEDERPRICEHLMEEITRVARALPRHTVVPYPNIPKKDYPTNI